jgi:bacillaene biosynthesis, polyketide synthase / nonribosomal peptide synthetase PksN/BaeN
MNQCTIVPKLTGKQNDCSDAVAVLATALYRYTDDESLVLEVFSELEKHPLTLMVTGEMSFAKLQKQVCQQLQACGALLPEVTVEISARVLPQADSVLATGSENKVQLYFGRLDEHEKTQMTVAVTRENNSVLERLCSHMSMLGQSLCNDQDQALSVIGMLPDSEKEQLLHTWNQNEKSYNQTMLSERFKAVVHASPDKLALTYKEEKITYAQLYAQVSALAHELQQAGVSPEIPVGVFLTRSPRSVIALLAIFQAGGAYVPLDMSYPKEHITYILKETQVPVVITEQDKLAALPEAQAKHIVWEQMQPIASGQTVVSQATPDNLALIMYTSGSTGTPKGVALEHRQVLNRFVWLWENYGFDDQEVACQRTTVNFIPSLWEMLGGLLCGVKTVIVPDEVVKDPMRLIQTLAEHQVTRIAVVPSLLRMLLDIEPKLQEKLPHLKLWFVAGEPLTAKLYYRFKTQMPQAILHNDYGATEVNGVVAFDSRWEKETMTTIPIGRPIANTQAYILDAKMQPVPVGVKGELYIGGAPISRGYVQRPDLTQERFVVNPFCDDSKDRLYNMGDIARYTEEGLLEVVGRKDHQVKLHGKRVELGGIEKVIRTLDGIAQTAVVVQSSAHESQRLTAFYGCTPDQAVGPETIRAFLKTKLPEYMVPTQYTRMELFPLTPNGKVDRQVLAKHTTYDPLRAQQDKQKTSNEREAIQLELVQRLEKILQRHLLVGDETIPFMELGLSSVDAVAWMQHINETFALELNVTVLFEYSKLVDLTDMILKTRVSQVGLEKEGTVSARVEESQYRAGRKKRTSEQMRELRLKNRRG